MRSVHIIESLPALRAVSRKRSRGNASRAHLSSKLESRKIPDRSPAVIPKRFLLAIESEGAVFDTLSRKHEIGYLPAFAGCFSWGQDPSVCGELWRRLALRSKLRGQDPLVILLSALRILNRKSPSVRRTAVGRALDTYLGNPSRDPFNLAASARGSSERMILDWIAMSDNLLKDEGYAPIFGAASDFLRSAKNLAPGSETLVYSSSAEAVALNQWEVAGVGDCFLRIAGAERGDFSSYLRSALKNGYDTCPILVVGSTNMAWQAAQAVGGRFFPILPGGEDESWEYFSHEYLPAFLAGEPPTLEARSRDFMRMMLEDVDISPEFAG